MAWLILLIVLVAAAFGVLGAVIKATAFLVLTILLTIAALAAIVWYSVRAQVRRWHRDAAGSGPHVRTWDGGTDPPRDLPSPDDRY